MIIFNDTLVHIVIQRVYGGNIQGIDMYNVLDEEEYGPMLTRATYSAKLATKLCFVSQ